MIHLDQQIEQLKDLVDKHLGRCRVMGNGVRCILPRNHGEAQTHKFPVGLPVRFCDACESSEFCRLCLLLFDIPSKGTCANTTLEI